MKLTRIAIDLLSVLALVGFCDAAEVFLKGSRHSSQVSFHADPGSKTVQAKPLHGARLAVVVAHHQENLAWLDSFAQDCRGCHVYVYTSSHARARKSFQHGTIREVANVGREWGKYLSFIIDEYQALQRTNATVLFLHGHRQANTEEDADRGDVLAALPKWPARASDHILFLHGRKVVVEIGSQNGLDDYGGKIQKLWPKLFSEIGQIPGAVEAWKKQKALDLLCFQGAEFSVPARQIVHQSHHFYELLERWLVTRTPAIDDDPDPEFQPIPFDYAAGTIFELLTYRIFQGSAPSSAPRSPDLFVDKQLLFPDVHRPI